MDLKAYHENKLRGFISLDIEAQPVSEEIKQLMRYRKELAWYALETGYETYAGLVSKASRLIQKLNSNSFK